MTKTACTIVFYFIILRILSNDSLDISKTVLDQPYPTIFTGMSSMGINDQVKYTADSTLISFSDTIISLVQPLHLKLLRFPGGTIGNYYHFYGKGFGLDTSEFNCAAGRLGNSWVSAYLPFDREADKNIIDYFYEELQALRSHGDNVEVGFRINSHTHFYHGDLTRYNASIQQLINTYAHNDTALLNSNGDAYIDSTNIDLYTQALYRMQNDTLMVRIKKELIRDSGFYGRFKENFDAIEYFRTRQIPIPGIEIGNETDGEYLIYDDDLSYLGYDCTNKPDSVSIDIVNLPLKYYFEGLLKNWIVVSLYTDSVRVRYNIPVGVPSALRFNYIERDSSNEPYLVKKYGLAGKKRDIWNRYFGMQPSITALIPHLYFQSYLECGDYANAETLYALDKYSVNKITEKFIRLYCDSSILYNLQSISNIAYHKALWITEWNFTDNTYATNTFLHAMFVYYFIRSAISIYEQYPALVQAWMYHLLGGAYYPWPLIRCGHEQGQFYAQKQIMYEPFSIWSNTLNQQVRKIKTNIWENDTAVTIDAFINNTNDQLYIQFVNSDTADHFISLNNQHLFNSTQELAVSTANRYILDAQDFTSTNFTSCTYINDHPENNSFQLINDTLQDPDSLRMPSLSIGKFTLHLTNKIFTQTALSRNTLIKIFPNPAENILHILSESAGASNNAPFILYNDMGYILKTGNLTSPQTDISLFSLSTGYYVLRVITKGNISDNQFIIIK